MPVEVYWDDPACSILITEYQGRWTEAELFQATDRAVALAATSTAPRLDNINTLLGSEQALFSLNLFRMLAYIRPRLPAHVGGMVMVTPWPTSDLALSALALGLNRQRGFVRHAWTMDEARAMIAQWRAADLQRP
jgi:hypothetical protein